MHSHLYLNALWKHFKCCYLSFPLVLICLLAFLFYFKDSWRNPCRSSWNNHLIFASFSPYTYSCTKFQRCIFYAAKEFVLEQSFCVFFGGNLPFAGNVFVTTGHQWHCNIIRCVINTYTNAPKRHICVSSRLFYTRDKTLWTHYTLFIRIQKMQTSHWYMMSSAKMTPK